MLFKKYASPFSLLDGIIETEQFSEWVDFFLNKQIEERNNSELWEFYLHKVYDKSFQDWKNEVNNGSSGNTEADAMDEAKKEKIIQDSQNILNGFSPSAL